MRRLLLMLVSLTLVVSCSLGILESQDDSLEDAGNFDALDLGVTGNWNVLIMTDSHAGRTAEKYPENFKWFAAWYAHNQSSTSDKIDISLIVHLGDITQNSAKNQYIEARQTCLEDLGDTYALFKGSPTSAKTIPFVFTTGNHDVRKSGREHFLSYFGQSEWHLVLDDISLYGLDSGRRYFGGTQIDKLQKALKGDSRKKIFLSHMPLSAQNLAYTYLTLTNEEERAALIHEIEEHDVRAYISGHRHILVGPYSLTDSTDEISLACLNGPDMLEDQPPRWYILHYDQSEQKATLTQYTVYHENEATTPQTKEVLTIDL